MTCKHEHGDDIDGAWVCGQCFHRLHERPRTYYMEKGHRLDGEGENQPLRQMARYAPIKRADSGLTLAEFVKVIALRLVVKTGGSMSMADATDYAVELLRDGPEFASPDAGWDKGDAWDLVAEDMQYWDGDEASGGNK